MGSSVVKKGPTRANLLDTTPGLIDLVAELYAAGLNNREMLENLPISDTNHASLRKYLKDDRVQRKVAEIMGERALRVRRKIDSEIDSRLSNPKRLRDMPAETLLKIRREYAPEVIHQAGEEAHEVMARLYRAASKNPELAEALNDLNMEDPNAPVAATSEEVIEGEPEIDVAASVEAALEQARNHDPVGEEHNPDSELSF